MANTSAHQLQIGATPAEVCKNLAEYILTEMARKAGPFHIALSGGSTPKLLFKLLAEDYAEKLDWSRLHCYWGDDRMVPYDSPESNYGVAKTLLFDHVAIPAANLHPVPTQLQSEVAASAYAETILKHLPQNSDGLPVFDLNLLGMGGDGHTASIFPNQMELLTDKRICAVATQPESGQKRVTLTGPVINASDRIVFLITGAGKADRLPQVVASRRSSPSGMLPVHRRGSTLDESQRDENGVLRSPEGSNPFPVAHILPTDGELIWFLDEAAAAQL